MAKKHCIISGTGRAGTSFLVQLLTRLGVDTGFEPDRIDLSPETRAGLEWDLRSDDAPYVVKSPWLCDTIEEILARPDIEIEHAYIPYRDLDGAARSRMFVEKLSNGCGVYKEVPGGLWHTKDPNAQAPVLAKKFFKLVTALGDAGVPMTFLRYPRLTQDPTYCYQKLGRLLGNISYDEFAVVFAKVRRPDWVHSFGERDR